MLSNNIPELRKKNSITQQQLSEAIGMKRTSLSKIENGEINPSAETMKKMSDFFNVQVGEIFFNPDVL